LQQLAPAGPHVASSPLGSRSTDLNLSNAALSAGLHSARAEWLNVARTTPRSSNAVWTRHAVAVAMFATGHNKCKHNTVQY
jgi:hypothetical protein